MFCFRQRSYLCKLNFAQISKKPYPNPSKYDRGSYYKDASGIKCVKDESRGKRLARRHRPLPRPEDKARAQTLEYGTLPSIMMTQSDGSLASSTLPRYTWNNDDGQNVYATADEVRGRSQTEGYCGATSSTCCGCGESICGFGESVSAPVSPFRKKHSSGEAFVTEPNGECELCR